MSKIVRRGIVPNLEAQSAHVSDEKHTQAERWSGTECVLGRSREAFEIDRNLARIAGVYTIGITANQETICAKMVRSKSPIEFIIVENDNIGHRLNLMMKASPTRRGPGQVLLTIPGAQTPNSSRRDQFHAESLPQ